jgi:hypothetical protein
VSSSESVLLLIGDARYLPFLTLLRYNFVELAYFIAYVQAQWARLNERRNAAAVPQPLAGTEMQVVAEQSASGLNPPRAIFAGQNEAIASESLLVRDAWPRLNPKPMHLFTIAMTLTGCICRCGDTHHHRLHHPMYCSMASHR